MKPLSLEVDFKATKKELEELHNQVCSSQGVAILLAHVLLTFPTSDYPGRHRFPLISVSEALHRACSFRSLT